MQKSEKLSFTEAVKTGVSIAVVRYQLNKLKDRQDEAEKTVIPSYQTMVKRDPTLERGDLIDYPMFKERCDQAEQEVKTSKGLRVWLSALEREKTFRTMTLELLDEAASHWRLSMVKGMAEIAEDTLKLFKDIRRTNEQSNSGGETRIQKSDSIRQAVVKMGEKSFGATTVLRLISKEYGEKRKKVLACFSILDNAGIYGPTIYAAYKYICNEDIQTFIKKLNDGTLIDEIKKHPGCEV